MTNEALVENMATEELTAMFLDIDPILISIPTLPDNNATHGPNVTSNSSLLLHEILKLESKILSSDALKNPEQLKLITLTRNKLNAILYEIENKHLKASAESAISKNEKELIDAMKGLRSTITINGKQSPIPLYKDRTTIEDAVSFFKNVYKTYTDDKCIYQDYLGQIDRPLLEGLKKKLRAVELHRILPPRSKRMERRNLKALSATGKHP